MVAGAPRYLLGLVLCCLALLASLSSDLEGPGGTPGAPPGVPPQGQLLPKDPLEGPSALVGSGVVRSVPESAQVQQGDGFRVEVKVEGAERHRIDGLQVVLLSRRSVEVLGEFTGAGELLLTDRRCRAVQLAVVEATIPDWAVLMSGPLTRSRRHGGYLVVEDLVPAMGRTHRAVIDLVPSSGIDVYLVDEQGGPLSGQGLVVHAGDRLAPPLWLTTDCNGHAQALGLAPGRYLIRCNLNLPGYAFPVEPHVVLPGTRGVVTLAPEPAASTLKGTLVDQFGRPVRNQPVKLHVEGLRARVVHSDVRGVFEFVSLIPGRGEIFIPKEKGVVHDPSGSYEFSLQSSISVPAAWGVPGSLDLGSIQVETESQMLINMRAGLALAPSLGATDRMPELVLYVTEPRHVAATAEETRRQARATVKCVDGVFPVHVPPRGQVLVASIWSGPDMLGAVTFDAGASESLVIPLL